MAVREGIPLKQTDKGLVPISATFTQQNDGTVALKDKDGQVKVLPHTGEKSMPLVSAVGGLLSFVSGLFIWKKRG